MTSLIDQLRSNGIVGAGGAGFPAYKKFQARVDTVIVNAAECEPLVHKDKELLKAFGKQVVEGLRLVCEQVGASQGVIGIKEKYDGVIAEMETLLEPGMRLHPLGDYYPAGDEFILVYEVTRQVIPPGGLPLEVGVVVSNVETLINVAVGRPVTHKYLTIAGAVDKPCTVQVPVGMSLSDTLRLSGVTLPSDFWVLTGGVMMGVLPKSLDEPVTRTTGAIIVLPNDHQVLTRYRRPQVEIDRIGRSACDQCSFCTELCPRFLIGHPIEPHRAMRSLGFAIDKTPQVLGTLYCCECNLCTMIACPEDLDPKNVCTDNKRRLNATQTKWPGDRMSRTKPNAMFEGRRTPVTRLIKKLNLRKFENVGPMTDLRGEPDSVRIPTKMHIGAPADPCVQAGAKVAVGDVIARIGGEALGVDIHASIGGTVEKVSESEIVIRRN